MYKPTCIFNPCVVLTNLASSSHLAMLAVDLKQTWAMVDRFLGKSLNQKLSFLLQQRLVQKEGLVI